MHTSSLKHTVIAAAMLCTLSAQAQFGGIGKKEEPKPAVVAAPVVVAAPAPVVVKPAPAPVAKPAPAPVAKPAPAPAAAAVVVTKPKPQPVKAAAPAPAVAAAAVVAAVAPVVVAKPAAAVVAAPVAAAAAAAAAPVAKLSLEDTYADKLSKAMAASAKFISTETKDHELRLTIADLSFIDALASASKSASIDYSSDMYSTARMYLNREVGKDYFYAHAKNIDIKVTNNISPKRKKQLVQDFLSYAGSRAQLTKSNTLIKIINSPSSNRLSDVEAAEMKKMMGDVFNAPFEIILESGTESSISVVNDTLATTQTPLFGVVKSSVTVDLDKTNPIANGIGQLFSLIDKKGQVANMVKQTEKVWLLDIKLDNGDTISVKQTVEDDNTFADKARVGILSFGDKQKAYALVK